MSSRRARIRGAAPPDAWCPSGLRTAAVVCAVLAAGLLLATSFRGHQTLPDLHRSNVSTDLSPGAITDPLPTLTAKNSLGGFIRAMGVTASVMRRVTLTPMRPACTDRTSGRSHGLVEETAPVWGRVMGARGGCRGDEPGAVARRFGARTPGPTRCTVVEGGSGVPRPQACRRRGIATPHRSAGSASRVEPHSLARHAWLLWP